MDYHSARSQPNGPKMEPVIQETGSPAPDSTSVPAEASTILGKLPRIAGQSGFTLQSLLSRMNAPSTYRSIGRVCGLLAIFVLIASIGFSALGESWFTGTVLLGLIWITGEASGAILEKVNELAQTTQRDVK
jgi:hypothetical protein